MISVVEKKWQGNFKPPRWALGHFFQQVVIKQWHNRKIMSSQISISGKKKGNIICYLQKVFMTNVLQCKVIYFFSNWNISSVQLLSRVWLFATPWTAARQASLSITNSQSLLKLMSNESVMPSNHLILCHPLLLLPSIFPSIRVFSKEPVLHIRWPKYFSFSLRISPSREYSGLISFRIDWFDLLAVQVSKSM